MEHVKSISRSTFDNDVLGGKGAFVVDLTAAWCAPCRMLAPFLNKLATEHEGRVNVVKLDYDENRELKTRFDLEGIPAILFFRDGELVEKTVGFDGYPNLRDPFLAFVELIGGESTPAPSERELRFLAAEKVAEDAHDAAEAIARAEYDRVTIPAGLRQENTKARADRAFAAGRIDETVRSALIERSKKKLLAIGNPAGELYRDTMKPVEKAYIKAIETAAEIFGNSKSTATENTEGNGNVCQIGDTACRV